jgi:hypothetical protein
MRKYLSKSQCQCILQSTVLLLAGGIADLAGAKTVAPPLFVQVPTNNIVISENTASELRLEVRQMPLVQVLNSLSRKAHVTIHYSVLPEGLVTATCAGSTLKQVLECLLNRKSDIIVRYPDNTTTADNKGQVAEAWILGSTLASTPAMATCVATNHPGADSFSLTGQPDENSDEQRADIDRQRTNELLTLAQSNNATEREDAIGSLLAEGDINDAQVKAALEQALNDQDENVRAQAVSTLAHLDGNAATGVIQEALRDNSVDVRLMAVDSITNDVPLLQQAVNDSDEAVRSLVSIKLEQLAQENSAIP